MVPRSPPADPRPRDRAATEAAIVAAAEAVLARDGFAGLSVQAVAAAAGVDRKLVYRYFGGLDGVVAAIGARLQTWLGTALPPGEGAGYAETVRALIAGYAEVLRGSDVLRRLLAWEVVGPSPLLARLDASRAAAFQARLPSLRGRAAAPPAVDAPAVNAVALAALNYLALRAHSTGSFAGIDLTGDVGWSRLTAVIDTMLAQAYGEAEEASK